MNILRKISTMFRLWKDRKQLKIIEKSNLFDKDYYQRQHPNLTQKPHIHYYYYGWKNLDAPSFSFSSKKYLERYEDVLKQNINPLIHYLEIGKKENRMIEFDENAPTLREWYQKKYQTNYDYKLFYCNKRKKIQLFVENSISKELISFINHLKEEDDYEIQLINYQGEKDKLKKIKTHISYCTLKENNYLECSIDDIFLTTSKKVVQALMHTKLLDNRIYYYIENKAKLEEDISDILMNSKVTILRNKEELKLKKSKLEFHLTKQSIPKSGILYLDLDSLKVIGLELLNEIFLRNKLEENNWQVYLKDKEINFFQLDSHVLVKTTPSPIENTNFYWREKKKEAETELIIERTYEEYNKETIDITKNDCIQKIKKIDKERKSENNMIKDLEKIWKEG